MCLHPNLKKCVFVVEIDKEKMGEGRKRWGKVVYNEGKTRLVEGRHRWCQHDILKKFKLLFYSLRLS